MVSAYLTKYRYVGIVFVILLVVGIGFAYEAYAQTAPRVSLSAHPTRLTVGNTSSLAYNATSDATSCTGSGGWSTYMGTHGTYVVSPKVTTTYYYTCSGSGGSASASVTVFVDPEPLPGSVSSAGSGSNGGYGYGYDSGVQLNVSPNTISPRESATLIWSAPAYNTCHAAGGWSGTIFTSGTRRVAPLQTTTYELICVGGNGAGNDSETLLVVGSPTVTPTASIVTANAFTASCIATPLTVTPGAAVTFTAGAAGGTEPVSFQWRGAVTGVEKIRQVSFGDTGTQVTTMVATDAAGKTATASCSATVVKAYATAPTPSPKPVAQPKATLTFDTADEIAALCFSQGYVKPAAAELAGSNSASDSTDDAEENGRKNLLATLVSGGGSMPPGLGLFLFMIAFIVVVAISMFIVHKFLLNHKKVLQEQELTKPL